MLTAAYAGFAGAHIVLAAFAVALAVRRPSAASVTLALPIAALVWDNGVVALGSAIGEGPLLAALSYPRFLGHALLTPVWIVTAYEFARSAGVPAMQDRRWRVAAWATYAAMVALGALRSVVLLDMRPVRQADVLYYTNAGGFPGPPIPAIVMVLAVIAAGWWLLRRSGWWPTLAGGILMFAAAAVPTAVAGFWPSNTGEVALALALVLTERHLRRAPGYAADAGAAA